ncbi:hypothetical protein B7494_g2131 [Chlorociboria aeruginascens]|nr:hypothetical protein B7494_g2131 [Chlorociboria aeruginascens]
MRYQNWDVLIFPNDSKIPMQEFKTTCQVIQDSEFHYSQRDPLLLPTVTAFIPGVAAGTPQRISIHSWENPDISRYLHSISKHPDLAVFEARVFIDGKISGTKLFEREGPWPTVIETSIELDKNGAFEKLKFPQFHQELLMQNHWSPGDDLGRIKVIIAEGFPRDNLSMPFERVKNIVSFSFQHAPLDVLEASNIAWPNAFMWRQASLVAPYYAQRFSPQQDEDGIEVHSHSPRRTVAKNATRTSLPGPSIGQMPPPNVTAFPQQPPFDPFTEPVNAAFSGWRHVSGDVSMPDYSSSHTRANSSRQVSDPMITDKNDRRFESMQMAGAFESICEALLPSAPVNTPQNAGEVSTTAITDRKASHKVLEVSSTMTEPPTTSTGIDEPANPSIIEATLAEIASNSLLLGTSIASTVKSRKENFHEPQHGFENTVVGHEMVARKVPLTTTNISGTKRPRVVTPAASKAIDVEDEPSTRKSSRGAESKEGERRALSGIENV